jgi:hypothetical protein
MVERESSQQLRKPMQWRLIAGFSAYEVSDRGWVRRGRHRLRRRPNHNGYLRIEMTGDDGRRHIRRVHALVLEAFVGPRPAGYHGAHGPGGQCDNSLANLRWAPPEENRPDRWATGRPTRLPPERVTELRARVEAGESFSAVARALGLHRYSVARIARGLRRAA